MFKCIEKTRSESSEIMDKFSFNTRQNQAYPAVCLHNFCKHFGIKHYFIDELVWHLISILSADNLVDWESKGAKLNLSGRGESLPEVIRKMVPISCYDDFTELLEYCIEVGVVDMYGDNADEPQLFLLKCIKLLSDNNIELPKFDVISKCRLDESAWGKAIRKSELRKIIIFYQINLDSKVFNNDFGTVL